MLEESRDDAQCDGNRPSKSCSESRGLRLGGFASVWRCYAVDWIKMDTKLTFLNVNCQIWEQICVDNNFSDGEIEDLEFKVTHNKDRINLKNRYLNTKKFDVIRINFVLLILREKEIEKLSFFVSVFLDNSCSSILNIAHRMHLI